MCAGDRSMLAKVSQTLTHKSIAAPTITEVTFVSSSSEKNYNFNLRLNFHSKLDGFVI